MIVKYDSASKLPPKWDSLIKDNIYMSISFLTFLERVSLFKMTYYAIFDGERIDSIFVTFFKPKHNIGMFSKKDFFIDVTLFYIPLSISRPAVIINSKKEEFERFFNSVKGCRLILNASNDLEVYNSTKGFTCPQCIMDLRWESFDDYLLNMRSNYRYRYNKAFKKSKDLKMYILEDNKDFNDRLYELYLEVYNNTRFQVERLTKEFFMDNRFVIIVLKDVDKEVGFIQLLENNEEIIFEFVGFDHSLNSKYDIYIRLLLEMVKYAINNKYKILDFGQTADEAKLKLGANYKYIYAIISHSNFIMNYLIKRKSKRLQYNFIKTKFNVFKED